MSKWPIVRLGDYIEQIRGVSYKPENLGNKENTLCIPLLRANNIQDDGLLFEDLVYVDKKRVHNKQVIKKGDIIICTSSGSKNLVGKAAQASCDLAMTFGAFCKLIRAKDIEKRYLAHYFSSPKYRHTIAALSGGVNINNLRNEHIDDLTIYLPPLETQKKIADVLDKAKSLIDLRKKQIEKMDLLIKSKFIEMFGDPVTNPKGWERTEIVRICEKIAGGGTPSKSQPDYYTGKIPWVTPKDMKKTLINDSIDHITEEAINNSSTKIIPKGSLLMVIRSGILKKTLPIAITIVPVSINQDMKAFIVNAKVNVWFLYYTLKILEPVLLSKVRGVTADNIEFDVIKNLRIPLPPLPLQSQFASFVEVIENQKNLLEQGLDKIEISYKSLMQEYFG